jgi:hypothetical protein
MGVLQVQKSWCKLSLMLNVLFLVAESVVWHCILLEFEPAFCIADDSMVATSGTGN